MTEMLLKTNTGPVKPVAPVVCTEDVYSPCAGWALAEKSKKHGPKAQQETGHLLFGIICFYVGHWDRCREVGAPNAAVQSARYFDFVTHDE